MERSTRAPVALITGASRGLGLALARAMAGRGWRLLIDARDPDALEAARAELAAIGTSGPSGSNGFNGSNGRSDSASPDGSDGPDGSTGPNGSNGPNGPNGPDGSVVAIAGDIGDRDHRAALARAAAELGGIDALVNNAGTLGPSPLPRLLDLPLDDFAGVLRTNVVAPLGVIQALAGHLRPGARVINVTSDAAHGAWPGWGAYGASKAALEQLSRVLAAELPQHPVYWVDPGDMRTDMHQAAFPGEDISDRPPAETSVPGLARLIDPPAGTDLPPSGRYEACALTPA